MRLDVGNRSLYGQYWSVSAQPTLNLHVSVFPTFGGSVREQKLSDETKEAIQNKLHHYLVRYRSSANKTQSQLASEMGYSLSAFERQFSEDNRVITAVETLKQFADLENLDVAEFTNYLFSGAKQNQNANKSLRRWETELLDALRHTDQSIRRAWSETIMKYPRRDLNMLLEAQTQIAHIKEKIVLSSLSILLKWQAKQNP
jgi:transcriptional regulator with XRE-family HTH domain